MHSLIELLPACWVVLAQMAPYLLFGFLMAGVLSVLISPEWVERHLGGRGIGPIFKAALLGVPLPLCSCGVIPVTASIRKHGASRGATAGFLLSTPQTGVDSIMATYALLGPVFALYRPLVALLTGVLGGGLVSLFDQTDFGGSRSVDPERPVCTDACCRPGVREHAVKRILRYGFITLPQDIAGALLAGILVAGVISVFVSEDFLAPYLGGGLPAIVIMMAVGIPIYVCSTASIPIALGFMHLGASPGAALAFLISGPATNAAAIAVVWRVLGRRTAIIYLCTVAVGALAAGWSLDLTYSYLAPAGLAIAPHVHHESLGWFGNGSAVALLGVLLWSLVSKYAARVRGIEMPEKEIESAGSKVTLKVTGMTCSHCANAVSRALRESAGVTEARVDLAAGRAVVIGIQMNPAALVKAVEDLGYVSSIVAAS